MDTNVRISFQSFYRALAIAASASDRITEANLSTVGTYVKVLLKWWQVSSTLFADHFYKSENFQTLNNRILYLMGETNLISFAAALQEAKVYADELAKEYQILVEDC